MNKPIYKDETIMLWAVNYTIKEVYYSDHLQEHVYVLKNENDDNTYEILHESEITRLVGSPDSEYNVLKKETLEELAEAYDNVCEDYREVKSIALKLYDREPLTKEEKETLHFLLVMRRVAKEDEPNGEA